MSILTLEHVNIVYDGLRVVRDVSFSLKNGETLALVGESGSGKSTVLRSIIGLLPPDATTTGHIVFDGINLLSWDEGDLVSLRGSQIAIIFQNAGNYFSPLKTIDSLYSDFLKAHGHVNDRELKESMLISVGFDNPKAILDSVACQLSGGMQQRVAIAMAMTLQPKLLLADEPTSALDAIYQQDILHLIQELCEKNGTAVLFVTHSLRAAAYISDSIAIMKDGEIVEIGSAESICNRPTSAYTKQLWTAIPVLE